MNKRKLLTLMGGNQKHWQLVQKVFGANVIQNMPRVYDAVDVSGNGRNGTATNVTAFTGVAGMSPVGSFGGTSFVSLAPSGSTLPAAFTPNEFTAIIWGKVSAAGVWTDGAARTLVSFGVNASNYIFLSKGASNNTVICGCVFGGTAKSQAKASISESGFFSLGLTVSKSNDRLITYYNGVAAGAAVSGLGIWAGTIVDTRSNLGMRINTGTEPFTGLLGGYSLINREATSEEMAATATPF